MFLFFYGSGNTWISGSTWSYVPFDMCVLLGFVITFINFNFPRKHESETYLFVTVSVVYNIWDSLMEKQSSNSICNYFIQYVVNYWCSNNYNNHNVIRHLSKAPTSALFPDAWKKTQSKFKKRMLCLMEMPPIFYKHLNGKHCICLWHWYDGKKMTFM